MEAKHKGFLFACFVGALALLVGGYARAGLWIAAPALPAAILVGWAIRRYDPGWLLNALLVVYTVEAAGGVLLGLSPALMIAGTALMLAGWEFAGQLAPRQVDDGSRPRSASASRSRIQLLAASVGGGLLAAEAGRLIHLPLPFGGVLLAGALILFSLYKFYRLFSR